MRPNAIVLAVAGLAPALAAATAVPKLRPSRDVTVVYVMDAGNNVPAQTVHWQATTGRQRVDLAGGKSFVIADPVARQLTEVVTAAREVHRHPMLNSPLTGGKADFKQLEPASFAGQSCTYWSVTPAPGTAGRPDDICLTKDGVMLAMRIGKVQLAHAITVTYAPADPALFAVPAGYRQTGG